MFEPKETASAFGEVEITPGPLATSLTWPEVPESAKEVQESQGAEQTTPQDICAEENVMSSVEEGEATLVKQEPATEHHFLPTSPARAEPSDLADVASENGRVKSLLNITE